VRHFTIRVNTDLGVAKDVFMTAASGTDSPFAASHKSGSYRQFG
jgi:hypothetical protein